MKYTYIKQRHGKTEETRIRFTSDSEERATHMETEIKSEEGAPPEFIEAMKALTPDFLEILDLPKEYGEGLEVHTLSLRHSDERWGVVMSGSKALEATKGPFNPSTPILFQPKDTDGYGKVGNISRELEQKILKVIACADAFRKGERAQQELELDGTQKKTGRGTADLTPIEEEVERQAKTFRAGEIPTDASGNEVDPESGLAAYEAVETPEEAHVAAAEEAGEAIAQNTRTPFDDEEEDEEDEVPLTAVQAINPTMITILRNASITTLEQLARAGRGKVSSLKGLGKAKMTVLDEALGERGLLWLDIAQENAAGEEAPQGDDAHVPEETAEPTGSLIPEIGDVVVPEKNPSFTLEVLSFGEEGDGPARVNLRGTLDGGDFRYALLEDLTWDPAHSRWTTVKLYTFETEAMPV